MKKMLLAVGSVALSASSALAAPKTETPSLLQGKTTIQGKGIVVFKDTYRNAERVLRTGDVSVEGTVKNPAQLKSGELTVSALKLFYLELFDQPMSDDDISPLSARTIQDIQNTRSELGDQ